MTFLVPLQAIPNQTLSITLEQNYYELDVFLSGGDVIDSQVMAMNIRRNGIVIVSGQRLVPGYLIIPYIYLELGNFFFNSTTSDYPDYTQFGVTQFLNYITIAELKAIRT